MATSSPVPNEESQTETPVTPPPSNKVSRFSMSKWSLIVIACAALIAAILMWWLAQHAPTSETIQATPTPTKRSPADPKKAPADTPSAPRITCGDKTAFADASMGMKFCYPADWGTATVEDAKLAPTDKGYRQVVKFSAMPLVQVGGVSDDWSTSVGRGGTCFDPSRQVPPLSSYNTDWHNMSGTGASLESATRSLVSSAGGYTMTEQVSDVLQSGVCVRGLKVINAAHYRVGSASFYRDFAPASGITTPALHVDDPNVLFSVSQRADFDALMASLAAY